MNHNQEKINWNALSPNRTPSKILFRDNEIKEIRYLREKVLEGHTAKAVVYGVSGVGKSLIINKVFNKADMEKEGVKVLRIHIFPYSKDTNILRDIGTAIGLHAQEMGRSKADMLRNMLEKIKEYSSEYRHMVMIFDWLHNIDGRDLEFLSPLLRWREYNNQGIDVSVICEVTLSNNVLSNGSAYSSSGEIKIMDREKVYSEISKHIPKNDR